MIFDQVFHSGIPITLIPLDATNDIPLTEEFFHEFEMRQDTYEAKYCFQLLKRTRDSWASDTFFTVSVKYEIDFNTLIFINLNI